MIEPDYIPHDKESKSLRLPGAKLDKPEHSRDEQRRIHLALEKVLFLQDFLRNMAHDLKTPIAVMQVNLSLLNQLGDSTQRRQRINLISDQLTVLTNIVDNVLTVARLETLPKLTFRHTNINHLVTHIEHILRPKSEYKRLAIQLDLDDNLPSIQANEEELQRALLNLIENAINYTPEQGIVKIRTSFQSERVHIEVADTGIGINPEELSHVFDEFYRASNASTIKGGTGLGLTIVRKVVELHHGSIQVDSVVGHGTTFRVSLPSASSSSDSSNNRL